MNDKVVIAGHVKLKNTIKAKTNLHNTINGTPSWVVNTGGGGIVYPHYDGSYTVTPSSSVQVLDTSDKVMDNDVTVQAVTQGSATTPATIITANPSISVSSGGLITATVSKTQQVTPTVIEGYVSAGTAGNVGVSGSATEMLDTQAAQTIHPASTDQSIASGKYLTGTQTFKAVTVTGLTADKVLTGTTVEIGDSDDSDRIMKVVGTASGGITPTGTKQITANGQGIDVYNYQYADVAVPNSYSASDEGKVVSNGALVAQTSDTVTTNNTYDTTLINSLTVNVSGGGFDANAWIDGTFTPTKATITTMISRKYAFAGNPFTTIVWDYTRASNINSVSNVFLQSPNLETFVATKFTASLSSSSPAWLSTCPKLKTLDWSGSNLGASFIASCPLLDTLILRKSSILSLITSAFTGTPFASGGTGGTIYIPKSLYDHLGDGTADDYQSATNWSTIYGYGTITWAKIEGSIYENAYADGTPIS